MTVDERYMARCIQLARCGQLHAAPNPMVGAVVVHDGHIIGEGFHICAGGPHAEVNALASVTRKDLLHTSTLYVSLEPCAHFGRTPPCADLIIHSGIRRVVVGCIDPYSEVSGRGIARLRTAGINVETGILEKECLRLNSKFFTFHTQNRPYITLKWAQSADGYIDYVRGKDIGDAYTFSTPRTSLMVHHMRAVYDAILVGWRTVLVDDPLLTNRLWSGGNPLRLVIDRKGQLPSCVRIFADGKPTRVYGERIHTYGNNVSSCVLNFERDVINQILTDLRKLGVQSLLVEGGAYTLNSFIKSDAWDSIRVEFSNVILGNGVRAPLMPIGDISEHYIDGHYIVNIWRH